MNAVVLEPMLSLPHAVLELVTNVNILAPTRILAYSSSTCRNALWVLW